MNASTGAPEPESADRLGGLLAATAPAGPRLAPDHVDELSLTLARAVVEADRGIQGRIRALRRRHRAAAVAATAVIVFAPTGAWAAQHFLAQTGRHGVVQPDGLQDGSELINMCAPDFARYVATLAPTDLPAAPAHTWGEYARRVAATEVTGAQCDTTPEGTQQASSLRLSLVTMATADWGCSLVRAHRAGDGAQEQVARQAMIRMNEEATRLAPGSGAGYPPDTFLANSRRPDFTGCTR
jgi:hypothetical protein